MKTVFFSLMFCFLGIFFSNAQQECQRFVRKDALAQLDTSKYIHDGYLNVIKLSEGENVDLYKSFFKGKKYRIVVLAEEPLVAVNFKIIDANKKVIFNNEKNNVHTWEYSPEENVNLMISVRIPISSSQNPVSGCVAILVGYKK